MTTWGSFRLLYGVSLTNGLSRICPAAMGGAKWYAVRIGRHPGIYSSWQKCQAEVHGFPKAVFKSFLNREDAESWLTGDLTNIGSRSQMAFCSSTESLQKSGNGVDVAHKETDILHVLQFDGGARGNPGPGGCGACIFAPGGEPMW
ncbi:unnamed protein product [Ostreobium quekettii]|uniref:Ribonuclease H n=1 Tax=Ostreobium quekettii TaxID=121088 RepID=A0A8S1J3H2_9CHLO|nr:unnamed protein product [Ostreobium quekettii]